MSYDGTLYFNTEQDAHEYFGTFMLLNPCRGFERDVYGANKTDRVTGRFWIWPITRKGRKYFAARIGA